VQLINNGNHRNDGGTTNLRPGISSLSGRLSPLGDKFRYSKKTNEERLFPPGKAEGRGRRPLETAVVEVLAAFLPKFQVEAVKSKEGTTLWIPISAQYSVN